MRSEDYGTWYMCVCLSGLILALHATRRPKTDTNGFSDSLVDLKMPIFLNPLWSKVMAWNTSERANMLISTASPQLVFAAVHTVEVTHKSRHESRLPSNATYEYSYPVGARMINWARGCGLYARFYIALPCMPCRSNLYTEEYTYILRMRKNTSVQYLM